MSNRKLSRAKIEKAIPGSGGLIAVIAKRCGYSWGAVRDFIRADDELTAMITDEEETIDDMAESTMIDKINNGDEASARWWLARRRRNRYGDNVDVTSGGAPVRLVWPGLETDEDSD
jgi:hypothetical protein